MFTMFDCALTDLEINVEILSDGWKWLIKSWVVRCSCEVETDYYAIRTKSLRQEINRERGFHWWNHQSLNIAFVSNFSCHRRDSSQYQEMILKILRGDFLLVQKLQCFIKCKTRIPLISGCARIGKILFLPIGSNFFPLLDRFEFWASAGGWVFAVSVSSSGIPSLRWKQTPVKTKAGSRGTVSIVSQVPSYKTVMGLEGGRRRMLAASTNPSLPSAAFPGWCTFHCFPSSLLWDACELWNSEERI